MQASRIKEYWGGLILGTSLNMSALMQALAEIEEDERPYDEVEIPSDEEYSTTFHMGTTARSSRRSSSPVYKNCPG
jgi:hypothetical protein